MKKSNRIAIVDLGTNTFHLLIVDLTDGNYKIVHRLREAVKLGKKGINKGYITDDAVRRALSTLSQFRKSIDQFNVGQVYAFGTSAFRNADNKQTVLDQINTGTGLNVNIISGDEEARLIYLGVRSAINLGDTKSLIIDIGGGSVEFVIGNANNIFWKKSFEIGAQRLLEEYHQHDPIRTEHLMSLQKYFDAELKSLFEALHQHQPHTIVGSSGTFDTLSDIYCAKHGIDKKPGAPETPLTFVGFKEIYAELIVKNRTERMEMPGMIELRVDMIVVACSLIDYILSHYSFEKIRVSSYALKEGVLSEIIEANHKK